MVGEIYLNKTIFKKSMRTTEVRASVDRERSQAQSSEPAFLKFVNPWNFFLKKKKEKGRNQHLLSVYLCQSLYKDLRVQCFTESSQPLYYLHFTNGKLET